MLSTVGDDWAGWDRARHGEFKGVFGTNENVFHENIFLENK